MTLTIACPNCSTPLTIPAEFEGKTGTCRSCGKPVKAIAEAAFEPIETTDEEKPQKSGSGSLWWFRKHDELIADWIPVDPHSAPARYRSDRRVASIRVFTQAGWIIGNVQAPKGTRLVDYLNHQEEFVPMLDVFIEGRRKPLDSFVLQKHAAYFLVVVDQEAPESATVIGAMRDQAVSCLFPVGSLYGSIRMNREVDVAQYLTRHSGFVLATNCHYRVRDGWRRQVLDDTEAAVLLNTDALIGISEREEGEAPRD